MGLDGSPYHNPCRGTQSDGFRRSVTTFLCFCIAISLEVLEVNGLHVVDLRKCEANIGLSALYCSRMRLSAEKVWEGKIVTAIVV